MRHLLTSIAALSFVLTVGVASPARAQDPPKPEPGERRGGGEGGPFQGFDEMPKQLAKFLKEQVDLTEGQSTEVEGILKDAFRDIMKRMMKGFTEGERPSPEDMRKEQEQFREQIMTKIRAVLDEGQRKELEVLVKEFENRGTWESRRNDPGLRAELMFEPILASKERILVKAENVLLLNEEEKAAILPLVEKVHDARKALNENHRQRRRDLDKALHGGAKKDELKDRMDEQRGKEQAEKDTLKKACDALREVLTLEQEARLVAVGILD